MTITWRERRELRDLISPEVVEFYHTNGELPPGFPVTDSIENAELLDDGSDHYCSLIAIGVELALEEMPPDELRLWAQRVVNDTLSTCEYLYL
jgi:hypothetical protein